MPAFRDPLVSTSEGPVTPPAGNRLRRAAQIIVISSVTFTFISYWRTAAVVLCDLGSTAFYIGGIVEQSIGKAAPWFILFVMLFSYAVRWVYIESCTLFVRGGVYRVVREAMGRFAAKFAVSALIFDYVLTGPISGVSAGQYIIGLVLEILEGVFKIPIPAPTRVAWKQWGSALIAAIITIYFFRQNLIGIHESSDKAVKIMIITTIMAAVMLTWCGLTLFMQPEKVQAVPMAPKLDPQKKKAIVPPPPIIDPETKEEVPGEYEDPTGFLRTTSAGASLRGLEGTDWLSLMGAIGIMLAFGHSVLAMSGEETLAQVYREVEAPKLPNFKKAAFIVFAFSLIVTGGISFLAVMLIPDEVRMSKYSDNLIGGLAMHVWAPQWAQPWAPLLLNGFVVIVGFLILAGATNTAIIGSNGVLNRVAEDGVVPGWFLKPHPKYGTTYRILYLITGLQLATILLSQGNVIWLGEAYAFGVVWSFVFQALSMTILRFKDKRPRPFKVPLNIPMGKFELPLGLILILLILFGAAIMNLLTKEVATIGGVLFTGIFFAVFTISERYYEKKRRGGRHEHLEQFNQATMPGATPESLGLKQTYRKLVAIRSPQNLFMLEKALAETDPETTGVVVMTAKHRSPEDADEPDVELDVYDQQLMTAVVTVAEKAGKEVKPLIVPTNNPLHAVVQMARDLKAQELIMGASNKYTADEQLEQIAFFWITLHNGETPPLTVRLLSWQRDVYLDLGGGNRIPKISERKAKSVAELRAAGVGVERVLLAHDGTNAGSDMLQALLTMLDPDVPLGLICSAPHEEQAASSPTPLQMDQRRARKLGRDLEVHMVHGNWAEDVVRVAREGNYNLIVLPMPAEDPEGEPRPDGEARPWNPAIDEILKQAPCRVFLAASPAIPRQTDEDQPVKAS